jgi:hypothetical protein
MSDVADAVALLQLLDYTTLFLVRREVDRLLREKDRNCESLDVRPRVAFGAEV